MSDLSRELAIAIELGEKAARAILPFRHAHIVTMKAGGEPVTDADHAANAIILEGLRTHFPADAVLSEETKPDASRLAADRVWIIDPIDGTKEFITGTDDFAVQIGMIRGGVPVVGVVYQIARRRLFSASLGSGAWLEDPEAPGRARRRLAVSEVSNLADMALTVSRWHRSKKHQALQDLLKPRLVVPAGSIGVKVGLVAMGKVDLYLHPSKGTAEWDTCAPDAILHEAGGLLTDFAGKRLSYNMTATIHPNGIVASNGRAHQAVLDRVAGTMRSFGFTA